MTDKRLVKEVVIEELKDSDMFLVEINISQGNSISIVVDAVGGVSIGTCIKLSKSIEGQLDRESEDFELSVMSAGIGQEFKVLGQYHKNLGNQVELLTISGNKAKGKLIEVTDTDIQVEIESMEKVEGKKKKQLVLSTVRYSFEEIKSIKDIITF